MMARLKVGLAALVCLWAGPALAVTVVIARPVPSSARLAETVVRMRGELLSSGFDVETVEAATDGGAGEAALPRYAARRGAQAVIAVQGRAEPTWVQVWAADPGTGRTVVRALSFEPFSDHASETLSIRAIELLRSCFAELDLTANGQPRKSTPAAAEPVAQVETSPSRSLGAHLGASVGGAAVMGFDGVGPALLPMLRMDWALSPRLVAQATLAGLGTKPTVDAQLGSARITQQFGTIGASYRWLPWKWLQPHVSLAAGVLHTSLDGHTDLPGQSGHDAQWSALLDGGLGAWLPLGDRFYAILAAHAQLAQPYLGIRFLDKVVASSARPNLVTAFTVGTWL